MRRNIAIKAELSQFVKVCWKNLNGDAVLLRFH